MLKQYDMLPEKEKSERARMLTTLNLNTDSAFITFDNNVKIFIDGTKLFKDIIAEINNAKESINVEFYTFYSDDLGNHVLKALEDAARRGVKVRVIYDASGSLGTKSSYFDNLRKLGGEAQTFISTSNKYWFRTPRLNYHLHRKLVIIDRS